MLRKGFGERTKYLFLQVLSIKRHIGSDLSFISGPGKAKGTTCGSFFMSFILATAT